MPEFLRKRAPDQVKGTDELVKFIRPPFFKIVQGASDKDLKEDFPEASVLLVPGNDLLAEPETPILFTPILFYREFLSVNPLELKGQMKMVEARSTDPKGDIAKRAMDPDRRNEPLKNADGSPMMKGGKQMYRSHQDVRVFLVDIHAPRKPGRIVAMTFSRGELRTADRLSSLIGARQKDIFAGVFEAVVGIHKNPEHTWYGLNIDNPTSASPWVNENQFAEYERMHDLLQKAVDDRTIEVDLAGETGGTGANPDEPAPGSDTTVKTDDAF